MRARSSHGIICLWVVHIGPSSRQQWCRYDAGGAQSSLQGALAEFFHPDTAAWLLTEMAQNRDKALGAKKVLFAQFRERSSPAGW